MKVYIAFPFFNEEELRNVEYAENILEKRGFNVCSPRLDNAKGILVK